MRWQEHKNGDVKIKKKFALFPIEINGENRWLEWVIIKYVYHNGTVFSEPRTYQNYRYYGWKAEEFIDENKTIQLKSLTFELLREKHCINCQQYRGENHDYKHKSCERCMENIKSSQKAFQNQ